MNVESLDSEIRAEFDLRRGEYAQVTQLLVQRRYLSGVWLGALILGGGWVLWRSSSALSTAIRDQSVADALSTAPWFLFIGLWAWYLWRGAGFLAARRAVRATPPLEGQVVQTLGPRGLRIDFPSSTVELQWENVVRLEESDSYFLWVLDGPVHFTPKRVLTASQIDSLRRLI